MDMRSGRSVRKNELQQKLLAASDGNKITALAEARDGFQGYVKAAASSSYFGGLLGGNTCKRNNVKTSSVHTF